MGQLRSIIVGLVALSLLAPVASGEAALARKIAKPKPPQSPVKCEMSKFRIVVDVGHTPDSYGALSARNDTEFGFNFRLARLITAKLSRVISR